VLFALFAISVGWVTTTVLFVAIPVVIGLRADVRAAREVGLPNARAVASRRFFVPRSRRPLHAALLNRVAWIERNAMPAHEKRAMRVTAVRAASLQFEDGSVFEPRTMSRGFADGAGAAKGVMHDPRGNAGALVVFT
jgi:hypothetical protein